MCARAYLLTAKRPTFIALAMYRRSHYYYETWRQIEHTFQNIVRQNRLIHAPHNDCIFLK